MTCIEDLLEACSDWSTVDEIQERVGLPSTSKAHRAVRNCLRFWLAQGALETRKEPDGPRMYRAGEWHGRKIRPVQPRIVEALTDGPKTVRQVSDATGVGIENAWRALHRMKDSGKVVSVMVDRRNVWSLREADADGLQERCLRSPDRFLAVHGPDRVPGRTHDQDPQDAPVPGLAGAGRPRRQRDGREIQGREWRILEEGPMPTRREVLAVFADWSTVGDAADRLGCPRSNVNSHRGSLLSEGYLESRFVDGIGNQYRATGKPLPSKLQSSLIIPVRPPGRPSPHQEAILRALESGPMAKPQLLAETGCPKSAFNAALLALERKGRIERIGPATIAPQVPPATFRKARVIEKPETGRDRVLAACTDWTNTDAIAEATGIPRDLARYHRKHMQLDGRLETRWTDGIGFEVRATGKKRPLPRLWAVTLSLLSDGPKTARQIADATGRNRPAAANVLVRMERHGLVVREGKGRFTWRLAQ